MNRIIKALLVLYIFFIPFQMFLKISFFLNKIQLPEIIFVLIIIAYLFSLIIGDKQRLKISFSKIDFLGLTILFSTALTAFLSGINNYSLYELIGVIYLFFVYLLVKTYFVYQDLLLIFKTFIFGVVISSFFGFTGFLFSQNSFFYNFIIDYKNYPYLGDLYRLRGVTPSPNMIANLQILAVFFLLIIRKQITKTIFVLTIILLLIFLFLTFSRYIVLFLALIILFAYFKSQIIIRFWKIVIITGVVSILFVFHFFSNFYIINISTLRTESTPEYIKNLSPLLVYQNYALYPTDYFYLKKASVLLFKENLLFGVGPGNFNTNLPLLESKNEYPSNMQYFDPHSSVFGIAAEQGIIGILSFAVIAVFIFSIFLFIPKINDYYISLSIIILFLLNEAVSTDIVNFRQYWILFSVIFISLKHIKGQSIIDNHKTKPVVNNQI